MTKKRTSCLWALFLALFSPLCGGAQTWLGDPFIIEEAPEWTALFDRNSGWTGADGIYSIPLDSDDRHGSASGNRTLFLFSDTFIGDVGPDGNRLDPTVMINNTAAVLGGGVPDPEAINFLYRTDGSGSPASLAVPRTPAAQPGHWYWLGDGVAIEGTVHVFGLRMKSGGQIGFLTDGVAILSFPVSSQPGEPQQIDTPLFLPDDGTRGDIIFGAGILANTAAAGAPDPDGYIYIYGTQNDPLIKKLVAARVRPETFLDFSTWEYFTLEGWTGDINRLAPLTTRVSNELSVSPLPDGSGRFALVFQEDAIGRYVSLRIGGSPIGPWSGIRRLWECPEVSLSRDIYTYNAKAHPHLSGPDELLISYNVNTLNFWDHFTYADIYRPRFIRIKVDSPTQPQARDILKASAGFALTAAPNPFNPATEVSFRLPESGGIRVTIHDVAGHRVRTLYDGKLDAGTHTLAWNGRDQSGRSAAAGVYLVTLTTPLGRQSLRLSLIK